MLLKGIMKGSTIHWLFLCLAVSCPFPAYSDDQPQYLSDQQIAAYRQGKGMGLAKVAELNGYPGPRHVLDLATELALTKPQMQQSQKLFDDMQAQAQALGADILQQESQLEQLFVKGNPNTESLQVLLDKMALLQAQLRAVHLQAHIAQKPVLTPHQLHLYSRLRNHSTGQHQHHPDAHMQH